MIRHPAPDDTPTQSLKHRALIAFVWNMLERVGVRVIQFIPTIILARLLTPDEFGVIGMLTLFVAVSNATLDSGFSVALIQKKNVTHLDECSMFYFNIFTGGMLTLMLSLAAPLIAAFYNEPILIKLTRLLALQILINAFGLVQTARLTRKLDFKTQLQATLIATLLSGAIGVTTAYAGWGVWSLAAQSLARSLLSTTALWIICDWRPSPAFSLASLKGMFRFGSRMYVSSLIGTFFDNIYQVFIGKAFSAASLGFYSRAASLKGIVIDTTSDTLSRVLFPTLAAIQDEVSRLRRAYRRAIILTTFVHFPLMAGLIVVAGPLIRLLFSAKWTDSTGFFQLMCAAGVLYPLNLINLNILKVRGRSDLFLRLAVLKRVLIVSNIAITYRWGINAMLIGQIAITVAGFLLNSYYSERLVGYAVREQLWDVAPSMVLSGAMAGVMLIVGATAPDLPAIVLLACQAVAGAAFYWGVNWLIKAEALLDILALVKQFPGFHLPTKV